MSRHGVTAYSLLAALALAVAGCSKGGGGEGGQGRQGPGGAPVPVTVATAEARNVPVEITGIGNVQAFSTVTVHPQVSGTLTRALFQEGQPVRQGQILFQIDPRPYEAALGQARGNLERDRARAKDAADTLQRYESLVKKEYITQQQYESARADHGASKATVASDEAAVRQAEINLGYCTLRAPLTGRTGVVLVNPGNVVNPSSALVVIAQIQPTYVAFTVSESALPQIRARGDASLEVLATPSAGAPPGAGGGGAEGGPASGGGPGTGGSAPAGAAPRPLHGAQTHRGVLTFIDNQVNQVTGTVLCKATFPNADEQLWPGQFVQVVLRVGELANAVVVPSQAVQTGQSGPYVFVVTPAGTVDLRQIEPGAAVGDLTVIEKGVAAGERVVTDGQLRLQPGSKVQIRPAPTASDAGSPAP